MQGSFHSAIRLQLFCILFDAFAQAVKSEQTLDIFMGLMSGYPPADIAEYVRIGGRYVHELEDHMNYSGTEFLNVFFWSRKASSPEAEQQQARFRAVLYWAYAKLRHHSDFRQIAGRIRLPESVHINDSAPAAANVERASADPGNHLIGKYPK